MLNSRKSNPREAEEPPVQSEPVDLSRRSDQNHLEKTQFFSTIEDTKNNNNDGNKYITCDVANRISNQKKIDSIAKDRNDDVKSYWKTIAAADISSNYSITQEQKSPTTKNPVPKSPWRSNTQVGTLVKSKTVVDGFEMKKEDDEKFGKSSLLVLQVPKYNPQLIGHQNSGQIALETSKNIYYFFRF